MCLCVRLCLCLCLLSLCVVGCLLVVCCLVCVECGSLFGVCCLSFNMCWFACLLFVCLLLVVRCLFLVACNVVFVVRRFCFLFVVWCVLCVCKSRGVRVLFVCCSCVCVFVCL